MTQSRTATFAPFLVLLFTGTLSNSAVVPFMGYYLISALGQPPWVLSVYSGPAVGLIAQASSFQTVIQFSSAGAAFAALTLLAGVWHGRRSPGRA